MRLKILFFSYIRYLIYVISIRIDNVHRYKLCESTCVYYQIILLQITGYIHFAFIAVIQMYRPLWTGKLSTIGFLRYTKFILYQNY